MATMLIRFKRGTSLGGVGNDANPGEVHELPEAAARALIQQGRAEVAKEAAPAQPRRERAAKN